MSSIQISFICKGNICRSCYAEYKLREILGPSSESITIRSYGLETRAGSPADPNAIRIAASRGIDLNSHSAAVFDLSFIDSKTEAHLLLPMELGQVSKLKPLLAALSDKNRSRVEINPLSLYSPDPIKRRLFPNIRDPWGLNDDVFNSTFDRIDSCLAGLVESLRSTGYLKSP